MIKITLWIFPKQKRGSFTSIPIELDSSKTPVLQDLLNLLKDYPFSEYNFAKGTTFLQPSDKLNNGDIINIVFSGKESKS
jgi:hypothetical protein